MLLEIRGLTKSFGKMLAVSGVDLFVEKGQLKSIIGPNGAGKTTLFNLVTGKLYPDAGSVRFKGEEIVGLPAHQISRRGLARSFQITNVFPNLAVYENIRIAVQAKDGGHSSWLRRAEELKGVEERTERILKTVGLSDHKERPARNLSYGDLRHLEIGIALATGPGLLLLDEPTAGMSPRETQDTVRLIDRISEEVTILLIEHNIDLVMAVSDSVMVMHCGEKLAEGSPDEVAKDVRVKEAYLGSPE